jgi:hypothetical protein
MAANGCARLRLPSFGWSAARSAMSWLDAKTTALIAPNRLYSFSPTHRGIVVLAKA